MKHDLNFNQSELSELNKHGIEIIEYNEEGHNEADILVDYVAAPFSDLEEIKGLQFVQSLKVGYEGIDLERFKEQGVAFANARGVASGPIAEFVIMMLLVHYKNYNYYQQLQADRVWDRSLGTDELTDKKVMIFGTGHIGQDIAKRLNHFGMEILGVNTNGREVDYFHRCLSLDNVEQQLGDVDIVIGCLPLNDYTKNLYDRDFLLRMKRDAVFINVGRGEQLDEVALMEIIDEHLGHVFLDVTVQEPLPEDSPLYRHKKITITPHVSAKSIYTIDRQRELVIDNVIRFKEGLDIKKRVI